MLNASRKRGLAAMPTPFANCERGSLLIHQECPAPPTMKAYLISLRTEAWRTSSARYNAARRLRRRELFGVSSMAFFSAMTVAIAFLQRLYVVGGSSVDNYLTALAVSIGVLLLVVSLMEWGSANGAKAEVLHRNAEDLNGFQRAVAMLIAKLDAGTSVSWNDVDEHRRQYESIKAACVYNHEPVDDEFFRAVKRLDPEFVRVDGSPKMTKWDSVVTRIKWHLWSVWYFAVLWALISIGLLPVLLLPAKA